MTANQNIELSVLFPVHDLIEAYLDDSISSLLLQSYQEFELIFLVSHHIHSDFCSYIEKFNFTESIIVRILDIKLKGLAFALNYGLEISKGVFIARMDSDDISSPLRFEKQIGILKALPEISIVGCMVDLIDANGSPITNKKFSFFKTDAGIRNALPIRNPLCHPALIFRKDALFSVGAYQYGGYSEDHALFIKLARNKCFKFFNIPEVLFKYRRHETQSTNISNSWNALNI